jgi:predicted TIM-barrel fold metal-dependent hydrolase
VRINCHAHIFTLESVLSREAISIMTGRLRKMGFREFIVDAVAELMHERLLRPGFLTEDELLKRFVDAMLKSDAFKNLGSQLPFAISIAGDATTLGARAVRAVLDRLSSWIDSEDGPGKSPFDVFETLRIAMQPHIPGIAQSLLAHLGPDDAMIALMMDIVADDEPERDRRNFMDQIEGTQRAALMLPGRVFPFIAVNPKRVDHIAVMREAIEKRGFVGVKLYPSLGYEIGALDAVLDYCAENDMPITVHTTSTGFAKDDQTSDFSHPRHWKSALENRRNLRVCFAHCGGWGGFCKQQQNQIAWAEQIFAYMAEYPNVFADLSYHVDQMVKGGAAETAYLDALSAALAGPSAERILFGTDSWLLRLNIDDALYWRWFETRLQKSELDRIMRTSPARFLGLPIDGLPMRPNIARYVAMLEKHADRVGAMPSAWLRAVSTANWRPSPTSLSWSRTNPAHVTVYNHFRGQIPKKKIGRGFDDCAGLRLFELDYFTFGGSPPPPLILSGNTRNLMSLCLKNGGVPEEPHTLDSVRDRFMEILAEGRYTLADMGAAVESMYRFGTGA